MRTPLITLTLALAMCLPAAAPAQVQLVGNLSLPNAIAITDVWGYEDPGNGNDYAIVGDMGNKLYIVDVTDPASPRLVAEVGNVPAFDVKGWESVIYVCDGNTAGLDSRAVDIFDPLNPVAAPNGFYSAHNIHVTADGLLVLEFPGMRILDAAANPADPPLLFEDFDRGFEGHDAMTRGNLLYDFRGPDGTFIWDITDPSAPALLDSITAPEIVYHHSGDLSNDGTHLYICDELASHPTPDITVWDVSAPGGPQLVTEIADAGATVHNLLTVGDRMFVSYYSAGLKVFDISDPGSPTLIDSYDTSAHTGEGFKGAFGVYPYASSELVYVSDIDNGLFVFAVAPPAAEAEPVDEPGIAELRQNAPNPFNPTTTIPFELERPSRVMLAVYNVTGSRVRTLVDGNRPAGPHAEVWDGRDDRGEAVSSGVYFYRLTAGGDVRTRRMVLLK